MFGNGFRTGHMRFERLDWMSCMLYPSYVLDALRPPSLYAETRARYPGCLFVWLVLQGYHFTKRRGATTLTLLPRGRRALRQAPELCQNKEATTPRGASPPLRPFKRHARCQLKLVYTPPRAPFFISFRHEFLLLSSKRLRRR